MDSEVIYRVVNTDDAVQPKADFDSIKHLVD